MPKWVIKRTDDKYIWGIYSGESAEAAVANMLSDAGCDQDDGLDPEIEASPLEDVARALAERMGSNGDAEHTARAYLGPVDVSQIRELTRAIQSLQKRS